MAGISHETYQRSIYDIMSTVKILCAYQTFFAIEAIYEITTESEETTEA